MLQWLMQELGVGAERTLMIGDTTHDMQMARNAGVSRVAVAHGAHEACELLTYEPLACLNDCGALLARAKRVAAQSRLIAVMRSEVIY
jgi:phosphoglycolate phosphatase